MRFFKILKISKIVTFLFFIQVLSLKVSQGNRADSKAWRTYQRAREGGPSPRSRQGPPAPYFLEQSPGHTSLLERLEPSETNARERLLFIARNRGNNRYRKPPRRPRPRPQKGRGGKNVYYWSSPPVDATADGGYSPGPGPYSDHAFGDVKDTIEEYYQNLADLPNFIRDYQSSYLLSPLSPLSPDEPVSADAEDDHLENVIEVSEEPNHFNYPSTKPNFNYRLPTHDHEGPAPKFPSFATSYKGPPPDLDNFLDGFSPGKPPEYQEQPSSQERPRPQQRPKYEPPEYRARPPLEERPEYDPPEYREPPPPRERPRPQERPEYRESPPPLERPEYRESPPPQERPEYREPPPPQEPPEYEPPPYPEQAEYEPPEYGVRPTPQERPRPQEPPEYDPPEYRARPPPQERPEYQSPEYHDPPSPQERPRPQNRPEYDPPEYHGRPRPQELPRPQERPEYTVVPRPQERPEYHQAPRPQEPSEYQEPPRPQERPEYNEDPRPDYQDRPRPQERPVYSERPRPQDPSEYHEPPRPQERPEYTEDPRPQERPRPLESPPYDSYQNLKPPPSSEESLNFQPPEISGYQKRPGPEVQRPHHHITCHRPPSYEPKRVPEYKPPQQPPEYGSDWSKRPDFEVSSTPGPYVPQQRPALREPKRPEYTVPTQRPPDYSSLLQKPPPLEIQNSLELFTPQQQRRPTERPRFQEPFTAPPPSQRPAFKLPNFRFLFSGPEKSPLESDIPEFKPLPNKLRPPPFRAPPALPQKPNKSAPLRQEADDADLSNGKVKYSGCTKSEESTTLSPLSQLDQSEEAPSPIPITFPQSVFTKPPKNAYPLYPIAEIEAISDILEISNNLTSSKAQVNNKSNSSQADDDIAFEKMYPNIFGEFHPVPEVRSPSKSATTTPATQPAAIPMSQMMMGIMEVLAAKSLTTESKVATTTEISRTTAKEKPRTSTDKPRTSNEKPLITTSKPRTASVKPGALTEKPRTAPEALRTAPEALRTTTEKPRTTTKKPGTPTEKPRTAPEKLGTPTEKPRTAPEKLRTPTDKPRTAIEKTLITTVAPRTAMSNQSTAPENILEALNRTNKNPPSPLDMSASISAEMHLDESQDEFYQSLLLDEIMLKLKDMEATPRSLLMPPVRRADTALNLHNFIEKKNHSKRQQKAILESGVRKLLRL